MVICPYKSVFLLGQDYRIAGLQNKGAPVVGARRYLMNRRSLSLTLLRHCCTRVGAYLTAILKPCSAEQVANNPNKAGEWEVWVRLARGLEK
jgi:hypothetical protein